MVNDKVEMKDTHWHAVGSKRRFPESLSDGVGLSRYLGHDGEEDDGEEDDGRV